MSKKNTEHTKCSFCGKTSDMVDKIISGPDNVCICNEIKE